MFNKILVTTDGSELALKGVRGAAQLAGQLTVEEPYSYSNVTAYRPESFEQYKDRVKAETEERLESARKAVDAEGIKAETVAVNGSNPADGIVQFCNERKCDLIVIASHGRSGLSAVLLGSVARKVLTEASVPVLVYR
jgi:nucleotide-binding universal stress UspA family protein